MLAQVCRKMCSQNFEIGQVDLNMKFPFAKDLI